ncbi:UDP-N-acetylmuramate dehydrogenase [Bacteroidota bacterium]
MSKAKININFQHSVSLSELTTIKLGGEAKLFCNCKTTDEIIACLIYAKTENLPVQVIGGGSNIIFSDDGFNGIVIKIYIKGIKFNELEKNLIEITSGAGEAWDDFVKLCIDNNLNGVECLSGIPGCVGATPIQNVGAYGQEVSNTIVSVEAIDRLTLKTVEFTNEECNFGYRQSRFKNKDKDKYIITKVTYSMKKFAEPKIKYPELKKYLDDNTKLNALKNGKEKLSAIRDIVIDIRKSKSMIIDSNDPNTVSCGSFFLNPVLTEEEFKELEKTCIKSNLNVPAYKTDKGIKISAAWLLENAGFHKGYKKGGVGISTNHSLALINCGGSAKELLELSDKIENEVYYKLGVKLSNEPEIVKE